MANKAFRLSFGGSAAGDDVYASVADLSVDESTTAASFTLKLQTQLKDDGSWLYIDDDRFTLLTPVSIAIGFTDGGGVAGALGAAASALGGGGGGNDGLRHVFDGYITSVEFKLTGDPANAFIEITGMDTSVLMSLEDKIASWPNLADSDIVQQIVGGYGVQVASDSTSTVHQEDDTVVTQRGTDIAFVRALAQRNGFEFFFETDDGSGSVTAHFRAPALQGTPQTDLAIQFGDSSNLSRFSTRLTALRPLNVKVEQIDVKANASNTAQVGDLALNKIGDKDLAALVDGPANDLVTPADSTAQMLLLGNPTSDAGELQTLAQAVRDESGWCVTATGEINSDAYQAVLRPRRLVLVKGAGTAYSGKYYVTRVTHRLQADGGYAQSFEARRNAIGLDGSEQFGGNGLAASIPGF